MGRQASPLLSPQAVGLLLSPAAAATTVGGVRWEREGSVSQGIVLVRTSLPDLADGRLRVSVRHLAPSQPRLQYLIGNASVRRLCVNDPHRPFVGTHKHMINPLDTDEDAYEPDDIPFVPLAPRVAPGVYRAILEAFAKECEIAIGPDFTWVDPERRA